MNTPTSGMTGSGTPESQWTHVKWFNKVKDGVSGLFGEGKIASKIGGFFGWSVAILTSPGTLLGGLVYDGGQKIKSLFSRDAKKVESVEKKVPTKAEYEALQNKLTAAEAEVKKAKLENADLNNKAESQMDALVRVAEQDKADLMKNAYEVFQRERDSKVRCIRRQHSELEAQAAKIDSLRAAVHSNIAKIGQLRGDLKAFQEVAHHHRNNARVQEQNVRALEEDVRVEKERGDFLRSEWVNEVNKPWQDKILNQLFDADEAGSVASSSCDEDQADEGGGERVEEVSLSQVPAFLERMDEAGSQGDSVMGWVRLEQLRRESVQLDQQNVQLEQQIAELREWSVAGFRHSESVVSDVLSDGEQSKVAPQTSDGSSSVEVTTPDPVDIEVVAMPRVQTDVFGQTYSADRRPEMATHIYTATPAGAVLVDPQQLPREDSMVDDSMPRSPMSIPRQTERRGSYGSDGSWSDVEGRMVTSAFEGEEGGEEGFEVEPPLQGHHFPRAQGLGQPTAKAVPVVAPTTSPDAQDWTVVDRNGDVPGTIV